VGGDAEEVVNKQKYLIREMGGEIDGRELVCHHRWGQKSESWENNILLFGNWWTRKY
jgi:hypothetical protein